MKSSDYINKQLKKRSEIKIINDHHSQIDTMETEKSASRSAKLIDRQKSIADENTRP